MGMTLCAVSMTGKIVRSTAIYFQEYFRMIMIDHCLWYLMVHNLLCTYFVHHKVCEIWVRCQRLDAARQLKCATSPPSAASRTGVETPEILQTSMAVGHRCLARVEWI